LGTSWPVRKKRKGVGALGFEGGNEYVDRIILRDLLDEREKEEDM